MYYQTYGYPQPANIRHDRRSAQPDPSSTPRYTYEYATKSSPDTRRFTTYTYTTTRPPSYAYTPTPNYAPPTYDNIYTSPQRRASERMTTADRAYYKSDAYNTSRAPKRDAYTTRPSTDTKRRSASYFPEPRRSTSRRYSQPEPYASDSGYDGSPPPPYNLPRTPQGTAHDRPADPYTTYTSHHARTRAAPEKPPRHSYTYTRPRSTSPSPSPPPRTRHTFTARTATSADAIRAGIPAGYSLKNWDPTETPLLLLGSVFDANSLGKWIYDWTVYAANARIAAGSTSTRRARAVTEDAGNLWLSLIALAARLHRADDAAPLLRRRADRRLVADYAASGRKLWRRLEAILVACEAHMWRVARRDAARAGREDVSAMGPSSGLAFVECMFGKGPGARREETARLASALGTWRRRFDAECDAITRYPDR